MNERLRLAKKLLKDDGVIFVSIDDSEQAYLKVLMDEIFGEENFVASMPRKTTSHIRLNSASELQKLHDYIL
ncbi:type III restriction endonuclease subunit M, partial [Rhizobium sp. KAs_5_22]